MQPRNYDELETDVQKLVDETQALRNINQKLNAEIELMGGSIEVGAARVEHLLSCLLNIGLITEKNIWEINRDWELSVRPQLRECRNKMLEVAQQQKAAQQRAQGKSQSGLIIPNR